LASNGVRPTTSRQVLPPQLLFRGIRQHRQGLTELLERLHECILERDFVVQLNCQQGSTAQRVQPAFRQRPIAEGLGLSQVFGQVMPSWEAQRLGDHVQGLTVLQAGCSAGQLCRHLDAVYEPA
jgi:hypothetical protein